MVLIVLPSGMYFTLEASAVCLNTTERGSAIWKAIKPCVYGSNVDTPACIVPAGFIRALGVVFKPRKPVIAGVCLWCCVLA